MFQSVGTGCVESLMWEDRWCSLEWNEREEEQQGWRSERWYRPDDVGPWKAKESIRLPSVKGEDTACFEEKSDPI